MVEPDIGTGGVGRSGLLNASHGGRYYGNGKLRKRSERLEGSRRGRLGRCGNRFNRACPSNQMMFGSDHRGRDLAVISTMSNCRGTGGPGDYAVENYVAWRAGFPEHAALFVAGGVGENLAIQGLDEQSVCFGDHHLTAPLFSGCANTVNRATNLRFASTILGSCGRWSRTVGVGGTTG
jgi:hypothetical protein